MCVWAGGGGGGDEAISKLKGAGGNACPPTPILACVLPTVPVLQTVSLKQTPTVSF